jgi:hypothetical protein
MKMKIGMMGSFLKGAVCAFWKEMAFIQTQQASEKGICVAYFWVD